LFTQARRRWDPVGQRYHNPILDTREYKVEVPDGAVDTFTANLIAENMYSQVDADGCSYALLRSIINHKSDGSAIRKDHGFENTKNGSCDPDTGPRAGNSLFLARMVLHHGFPSRT
jgi:hypothetical protein